MEPLSFIFGCFAGVAGVVFLLMVFMILRPWVHLKTRGGRGSLFYVFAMRLRGNPVLLIIDAYSSLLHSGVVLTLREVEAHYVANQARIMTVQDLVNSIRKDPVETHVHIWIENDDAQWLATYCSERASAIWQELERREESGEQERDSQLATEAKRLDSIATCANGAALKVQRAQGRG